MRASAKLQIAVHLWLTIALSRRGSSEADSPWTQEKLSALQAERNAVEEELLEHMADQDVKHLKFKAVSHILQLIP